MAVLNAWDRTTDADSRGALLFTLWVDTLEGFDGVTNKGWRIPYDIHRPLETPMGLADPAAAVKALDAAAQELMATKGSLDAPWSSEMRLIWGGRNLPASGAHGRYGDINVIRLWADEATASARPSSAAASSPWSISDPRRAPRC